MNDRRIRRREHVLRDHPHDRRLEIDHVREHTHQHLRSSLSADAAVHVGLTWKVLGEFPTVSDGIAEEYHAAGVWRQLLEPLVVGVVAAELIPVLQLIGEGFGGGRQAAVGTRRSELLD